MQQHSAEKPSLRIPVELSARACGDELVGWIDGTLKIRVAATQRNGHANTALESLLAEVIGVPHDRVRVVAGHQARRKLVEIDHFDENDLDWHLPGRDHPGTAEVPPVLMLAEE